MLRVTFLGTGGAVPTTGRNTSVLFVQREGDRLLFDCGEGTQRQMMRFGTGFTVSHLFVTHTHGDHVLGIPGLLQTWDFNDREAPVAIHAPNGTRETIRRLTRVTGAPPDFPVRINEVGPGDVALSRDDYEVRTFEVDHRATAVGYALVEDDRKGRFDRERAEELGVPPGPMFSALHDDRAVELDDGRIVEPPIELEDGPVVRREDVVGASRPGRRLVYTGDTRPSTATVEAAADADLLVHDATFTEDRRERASETGHATAAQAAEIGNRAGAKRLALTHVSSRYAGEAHRLEDEAREVFEGEAFLPDDGDRREIPYPDE
jgi:ribonuclease Z